jgi:hypothetical protein
MLSQRDDIIAADVSIRLVTLNVNRIRLICKVELLSEAESMSQAFVAPAASAWPNHFSDESELEEFMTLP